MQYPHIHAKHHNVGKRSLSPEKARKFPDPANTLAGTNKNTKKVEDVRVFLKLCHPTIGLHARHLRDNQQSTLIQV